MGHRAPPRFATQTMATTFGTVVLILIVVLVVVTLIVRDQVRSTVIAHLTTQQGMLRRLEERRMSEMQAQAELLAESPTVKAAMDTSHAESLLTGADHRELLDTVGRELDRLAQRIRPDTRSAYVGAIRALALALDARDPYTAGHSERVSAISVAVGTQLGLKEDDLDTLRLGALLHAIGKIGISDEVLRKPGALTGEEYDAIKQHPVTGARILRTVPFLAPHLPIVELQHERPDGKGYPHGLHADDIPILARIVHVVDAFDAMSSARAYRPARSGAEALQELWRCGGTQFDVAVVQTLATAIPTLRMDDHRFDTAAARAARKSSLVAFTRP